MYRTVLATIGLLALLLGFAVRADAGVIIFARPHVVYEPAVVVAPAPIVVSDAGERFTSTHDIQGVVTYFNQFNMTVRINGVEYPVNLHQGTIIRPTGATLAPSMVVNVEGYWSGGVFYANRIVIVRF